MAHQRKRLIERIGIGVVIGFLLSVFTCSALLAQATAQFSGTVKDQSGAVLPGVEVTATQTATGFKRNAITNESGSYVLTNLPIGPYRLEAALAGFRTYVQSGIVLQVNGDPIINAVLEVGQVSDQIEVQANATLVETRSTGVGQVIDNVRVLELPLNGRNAQELILLSGTAVGGGAQQSNRNYPTDSISIAGGLNNGLTYILDGGTHNDPFNNLNLPLPFPDALQEFKVETSAVPAQYGQHSAGAINAVTKSGTNEFHGDLFEFVRNGVFNARNTFALRRDELKRNQFGGTIGGPILKSKLLFFAGEQTTFERTAPSDLRAYVPTPAMLAGDWTAIASPACNVGRQITLRAPFVNNRIDPALFSKPAVNLAKHQLFPTTSDPCGEVRFGSRTNDDEHILIGKVDYQWSDKHSLFGRYQANRLSEPTPYDGENVLTYLSADYVRRASSFVLGDTYSISTNMVSAFRATLLRTVALKTMKDFFSFSDLGVKNLYTPPGFPKISDLTVSGGFNITAQTVTPGFTNSTVYQLAEDLSTVRGAHQIGFGVNYIRTFMNVGGSTVTSGYAQFTATNTGLGLGDFMLGRMSNWRQGNKITWYPRQNYIGMYLQDTWKANSRLTVNAGVRWEPLLPMFEERNKVGEIQMLRFDQARFDQGIRSTVFKNAPAGILFPGDAGIPLSNRLTDSHWLRFVPRLGLAWDPSGDGRMTVRAAYGVFFDYPHFYTFSGTKDMPPWGSRTILTNPAGGLEDPWQGFPGGSPFPMVLGPDVPFAGSGTYTNIPWDLKWPYVNQWNLSIQRQIGTDWLLSANYIGNSVIHLLNNAEGNPAIYLPGASCVIDGRTYSPCSSTSNTIQRRKLYLQNPAQGQYYGNFGTADDGGTRNYNGLALSIQRRRSKGVTIQGNYTWSHCIDDGTTTDIQNQGIYLKERRGLNRGNCADQDRRHNFNASTVYETPQFSNSTLRVLGSGWKISGLVRILSGPYMTVSSGLDNALTATQDQRPDLVLLNAYGPDKSVDLYLNPAAFKQPAIGTYGNLGGRNILGPGSITINTGLTRTFQVKEKQSLEFRAEAFNLPNHVNLSTPAVTLTDPTFGKIRSAGPPRIVQLALKYVF